MRLLAIFLIAFSSFAQAEELKLMTWNVFMLPKPIKNSFQKTRTIRIAETISKSDRDIVLMQEAFSGYFQKYLRTHLKEQYPYQIRLKKKMFPLLALNSGLVLVSKFPVRELGHTYFDNCDTFDCYATKGAILVEVTLPSGKQVQIATTHMQSKQYEKAIEIRATQTAQIRTLFDKHKRDKVPQLLVGDFNIDSIAGAEFERTLSILDMKTPPLPYEVPVDASPEVKRKQVSFFSAGYPIDCYEKPNTTNVPKLIDHVLYRENNSSLTFNRDIINQIKGLIHGRDCALSDHYSRQVDLTIN